MRVVLLTFAFAFALLSGSCGVKTDLITYERYEAEERQKAAVAPPPPSETEKKK